MTDTNDIRIEIPFDAEGFRTGMQELLKQRHYLTRMVDEVNAKYDQIEEMRKEAILKFIDGEPEQNRMVMIIPRKLLW